MIPNVCGRVVIGRIELPAYAFAVSGRPSRKQHTLNTGANQTQALVMSDLGWRADGIARARACGAVELEVYYRPGRLIGER